MNKQFLNITVSVIISILISIGIIEVIVRNVIDDGMNYDLEMMKYAINLKEISNNKEVGILHKKNKTMRLMSANIILNSNGFRNIEEVDLNKKKILMLGDSMTFGWGAQTTFSNILENKLKKKYQVLNAGIGNTNTIMQISNFFINHSNYNYDYIILNFFINDLENVEIKNINFFQKNFYSYTFIKSKIVNLLMKSGLLPNWEKFYTETFDNEDLLNKTFDQILKLKEFCEKNNISFVIHNIPELYNLKNYKFNNQTMKIKNFANDNNIRFINSLEALAYHNEKDLWVSISDRHANDKSHEIIGNFIFKKIFQE